MTTDPELIRTQIEHTRRTLSSDVDALAYQANPAHIAQRQVSRVKAAGSRLLDKVLGTAEDVREVAAEGVGNAADTIAGRASDVGDKVGDLPRAVRQQAQGNPLAAGAVAFGFGLLLAAVFPPTRKEQQWAEALKEQAQPLADQVVAAGKEIAGNLAEPAKQAVEAVKDSAAEAVQTVQAEVGDAVEEVRDKAQGAASGVAGEAQRAIDPESR